MGESGSIFYEKTEACAGQGSVFLTKKGKLCELETKTMNACNTV
jgi:hypothetical protein